MAEEQLNAIISAINHPIRREIVLYLAESGPQPYSVLLARFKLQTGTLNHHLEMLKDLLEQGEDKRYSLNRNGYIAYQVLTYARASLSKPALPKVKRRTVAGAFRASASGFYKLLFHPAKAFAEAQERLAPYALCGLTVLALLVASTPSLSAYTIARSLTGLLAVLLSSSAFVRLTYGKRTRPSHLIVSVLMSYLPTIILNLLTLLFTALEFSPWMPLPFIIVEDPGYIALIQALAALFIWRFVLLFLAIRESFKLTVGQSFLAVFTSFVIENLVAFLVDYLFKIPTAFL